MATRPFVPPAPDNAYVEMPMPPARPWYGHRPAEVAGDPAAPMFGAVGPDTGYVGRLARIFRPRLVAGRIHGDDAVAAGVAVAGRRAANAGRAPTAEDLEVAFLLLGVLDGVPGDWSRVGDRIVCLVRGSRRNPARPRSLAAQMPEEWVSLRPREVRERLGRVGPEGIWADIHPGSH
ncbi:MAG: hypothetical protein IT198_11945 [Acidimicrobiia bacterium]|nr:hypothetical protein [Acidimicrobiia bacterium]